MGKNLVIFSDGTGQAGGFRFYRGLLPIGLFAGTSRLAAAAARTMAKAAPTSF